MTEKRVDYFFIGIKVLQKIEWNGKEKSSRMGQETWLLWRSEKVLWNEVMDGKAYCVLKKSKKTPLR